MTSLWPLSLRPLTLRGRIALGCFAIALISAVIVTAVTWLAARQKLEGEALERMQGLASSQGQAVETLLKGYRERTAHLAEDDALRRALLLQGPSLATQNLTALLIAEAGRFGESADLALLDAQGHLLSATDPARLASVGHAATDLAAGPVAAPGSGPETAPRTDAGSDPMKDGVRFHGLVRQEGRPGALLFSVALHYRQEPLGNLLAWVGTGDLLAILQNSGGFGRTGKSLIVERPPGTAGRAAGGRAGGYVARLVAPLSPAARAGQFLDPPLEIAIGPGARDAEGEPVVQATLALPSLGWSLLAQIRRSEVEDSQLETILWLSELALLVLFTSTLLSFGLAAAVARPFERLSGQAARIGAGGEEVPVLPENGPEIEAITAALTAMMERLEASGAAFRDQGALYQTLVNMAVEGIVTIDESARIQTFNPACEKIFGYAADEIVGERVNRLMPSHYASEHDGYIRNYLNGGQGKIIEIGREVEGQRKNGKVFAMDLQIGVAQAGGRKIFVAILRDLSLSKAIANSNARSSAKVALLQRITRAANEADSFKSALSAGLQEICDFAGWPVGHACGVVGAGRDQLESLGVWHLGSERFEPFLTQSRAQSFHVGEGLPGRVLETGQPVWIQNFESKRALPRREAAAECGLRTCVGAPVCIGSVTVAVIEFFTTDELPRDRDLLEAIAQIATQLGRVAEREMHTKTLEARERDLARTNKDLEEFAYVASHDLRAPLRGIDHLTQWIRDDLGDDISEETRTNFERLRTRTARLDRLIEDLLTFSRAGRREKELSSVDVGKLVAELSENLDIEGHYSIDCAPNLPTFTTYRVPLDTVLRNLISNAIKHHDRDQGRIRIDCQDQGDLLLFTVEDDGPGIPEAFRERVFGIFQTLKSRTEVEGSGVGLAVVQRHVESLGGRVWIGKASGERGTAFHFTWPKQSEASAAA